MSIGSALARGQRAAEAAMTLSLTSYSPLGFSTDGDGLQVRTFTNEGTLSGKVQGPSASNADAATQFITIGGVSRAVMRAGLHIPVDADLPVAGDRGVGWEYLVTAVGASDSGTLVGRRFLVVGAPDKSFATARRLDVVVV